MNIIFDAPKIKIVLEHSITAHAFENDEQIHRDEFNKACGLIDKQIEKAENLWKEEEKKNPCEQVKKTGNPDRQHETISIFGNRGTGKTSFFASCCFMTISHLDAKVRINIGICNINRNDFLPILQRCG